jgi:nucleoside phosphorylase
MICDAAVNTACKDLGCNEAGLRRVRSAKKDFEKFTSFSPSIHIGPMGSADTVMKSAIHRDEIASKFNVIGFEMEGAGVWDYIPSLVIKSVCDYADSHKNKSWQVYAANTAAAAAKAFLAEWNS